MRQIVATVRPVEDADIAKVQEIAGRTIKACFPVFLGQELAFGYVDGGLSDAEIVLHREMLFVMVEDDRLVGFCIVVDDLIHLMMIDVVLHRLGLGSRMLAWCEAEIRRRGHAVARLETFTDNSQAVGFYRKNGWVETSRDEGGNGLPGRIHFRKVLP